MPAVVVVIVGVCHAILVHVHVGVALVAHQAHARPRHVGQSKADEQQRPMFPVPVWLNTTVIPQTTHGFLTAFPSGQSRPDTSNLNFQCQTVRANATPVALGTSDDVSLYVTTEVDLISDLYASFTPEGDGLIASDPMRIIDTRQSTHVAAGDSLVVDVTCPGDAEGCRDEDITGVLASVAVIGHARGGFITAYPCGDPVPDVSQINFRAHEVIANAVFTRVHNEQLCIYAYEDADLLVDLTGVVTPSASTRYQAIQPQRILDTRRAKGTPYAGRVASQQVLTLPIQSLANMHLRCPRPCPRR
jgi:hypothetical protein